MPDKACPDCNRIVEEGNTCPICKNNDLTTAWNGMIIVYDADQSTIAQEADISTPGKYAVRVKG